VVIVNNKVILTSKNTFTISKTLMLVMCFKELLKGQGSKRFGVSEHSSINNERQVIDGLKPLLQEFRGLIRLKDPDCILYTFIRLTVANFLLAEKSPICYKHAFMSTVILYHVKHREAKGR
jgi:hypothetical protein